MALTKAGSDVIDIVGVSAAIKADQTVGGVGAALTSQSSNIFGFKNYVINGNFDIWQRGTSQTSSGYGSVDRWISGNVGSTKTYSQITCGDTERGFFNAAYFSRTAVTSVAGTSNYVFNEHRMEDVTRLAGKTVTVSFLAKADAAKNIAIEFEQVFGTGGTPSATVFGIGSQLVALTTTWQRKSITVSIPSIVGKTIGTAGVSTSYTVFGFWLDSGSTYNTRSASLGQQSGTFDIAQVQIEEGSVATPFENRPIGLEWSLCQRYYQQLSSMMIANNSGSGSTIYQDYPLPTHMRISPSINILGTVAYYNASSYLINTVASDMFRLSLVITVSGFGMGYGAPLGFDAEL